LTTSTPTFTWSAAVNASGYWLAIGSTSGGDNIYQANVGNVLSYTLTCSAYGYTGLPENKSTIYVTLYSDIGGQWFSTQTTYIADATSPCP
jgi:hypothetical protein